MARFGAPTSPSGVGRRALGIATILAAILGLAGDERWFAAAGAFGTAWWAWDFVWGNVLGPLGNWFTGMLTGTAQVEEAPDLSLDDTVRLLESHLAAEQTPRHVQIQSALRLAEIYRINRNDETKARDVIDRVKARWPDSPELATYERSVREK